MKITIGGGGFTIIETLIGITLLAVILGGILSVFIVVQQYFKDGVALVNSQATARIVAEKMIRPIRHGESFEVSDGGNKLEVTGYDGLPDVFTFVKATGDLTGVLKRNDNTIASNIVEIYDEGTLPIEIFKEVVPDKLVAVNFGVKNEGVVGHFKEVHISTEMKLRNK